MATVNNRAVIETCLDITSGLIGLCLVIPSLFLLSLMIRLKGNSPAVLN